MTIPHDAHAEHEVLLSAIGRGDEDALERLYDAFERPLYALGLRILHDRQYAEEVVQDTVVKVWRSAARFDGARGTASGWIFTIARRSAIDIARREGHAPVPIDIASRTTDVGVDDHDAWQAWQVGVMLGFLPAEQRRLIELAVIDGYTHTEVAKALDIPLGTVKTRIYTGLRKLRKELERLDLLERSS